MKYDLYFTHVVINDAEKLNLSLHDLFLLTIMTNSLTI